MPTRRLLRIGRYSDVPCLAHSGPWADWSKPYEVNEDLTAGYRAMAAGGVRGREAQDGCDALIKAGRT